MYSWLIFGIFLTILELATINLVSIWFAIGAYAAFIASCFSVGFKGQIIIFCIFSSLLLALTRPLVKKFHNRKVIPTNADSLIGENGFVTESITQTSGRVDVNGQSWAAKSEEEIKEGEQIRVEAIEGVKLIVARTGKALESTDNKI